MAKLSAEDLWTERVELTRDARGRFSIAEVHGADPESRFHHTTRVLPAVLSSLSRGALTRLRFVGSAPMPRQLAAIRAAAAQSKIALELPEPARRRG